MSLTPGQNVGKNAGKVLQWVADGATLAGRRAHATWPWRYSLSYLFRNEPVPVWTVGVDEKVVQKLVKERQLSGKLSPDQLTIAYTVRVARSHVL